jgi:hypothetical protein
MFLYNLTISLFPLRCDDVRYYYQYDFVSLVEIYCKSISSDFFLLFLDANLCIVAGNGADVNTLLVEN